MSDTDTRTPDDTGVLRRARRRWRPWVLVLVALTAGALVLWLVLPPAAEEPGVPPVPQPTATDPQAEPDPEPDEPRRPYAADSPWNTPIPPDVRVLENSDALVGAIAAAGRPLSADPDQYTIPVYEADADTPRRTVHLNGFFSSYLDGDDSRQGHGDAPVVEDVPVPEGARSSPGSDGQIVIIDTETGLEYGFWQWAEDDDGRITATNGYRYGTGTENYGRFADGLSGRGAGLPYYAGLVRPWEVEQGSIEHALAFAYHWPSSEFVYPASKSDGLGEVGVDVPEGTRLQLDPSLTEQDLRDLGLTPEAVVIAKALQEYGMYVVDNSGSSKVYLEDRMTAGWGPEVDRSILEPIPWSAFRAVEPPELDPVARSLVQ